VEYDPTVVTFDRLLEVFWEDHDPCAVAPSDQYKAILFFHDADQEREARASAKWQEERAEDPIRTEIRPAGTFWPAEDYHQKYYLRHSRLGPLVRKAFATEAAFIASRLAARANGLVGGHATIDAVRAEARTLGIEIPDGTAEGPGASCGR
jgi:hypothetical protein